MTESVNNKKLHIAMIGHKQVPSREGGIEVVVWELATRLKKAGYDVDCYNRSGYLDYSSKPVKVSGKKGKYIDGIRVITIPTLPEASFNAAIYTFLATVRAVFGHYDVIHYHAEGPCLMIWLPKLFGIKTVATIHGLDWKRAKWNRFASWMIKIGEKKAAKYADEIIVLSKGVQDYFLNTYSRQTHFIPNGISRPVIKKPDIIVKEYGLRGNDYIMTLCRIVPEKGIHYLLKAFKEINTDKKLVIAGNSGNAASYMKEIKELAAEDDRVIMTGLVTGEKLQELLSNAYLYVLPSDIEGMSISLLEAMSYGNACLVSDIEENIDVVEQYAESFKQGNISDLKDKLALLLDNEEMVLKYKDNAAGFICNKFDWDIMTEKTKAIY